MNRKVTLLGCLVSLLVGGSILLADAGKPVVSQERIEKLIAQLGSAAYAEREQATKELRAIGEAALSALKEAAEKTSDPEIKRRASDLVRVIEAELAAELLRRPTLISVAYHNTPVPDVLQDLTAKTGVPFQLQRPERLTQLRQKMVTLRLDQKPLWEVVDQVLAACGLRQAEPLNNDQQQIFIVEEGECDRTKICYSGVARIRWLSRPPFEVKPPSDSDRQVIYLEVCIEPKRFIAEGTPSVAGVQLLDKRNQAIDAGAQALPAEQPNPDAKQSEDGIVVIQARPGAQVVMNARIIAPGLRPREPRWRIYASLALTSSALERAAKLRGQLDMNILGRQEITIPKPLTAERKTYGDPNRFLIRLVDVSRENRQLKVLLECSQLLQPNVGVVADPRRIQNQDFVLYDEDGEACPIVGRALNVSVVGNVLTHQFTLSYQLPKNQSEPSKLVIANYVPNDLSLPFEFALKHP